MAVENFTTYTEEDDNNKLTVSATKALGADVDTDEDVYLYKDRDPDHFDALDIDFEVYIASTGLHFGHGGVAVTNTVASLSGLASTDLTGLIFRHTNTRYIRLVRGHYVALDSYICSSNTLYYCTITRAAGNDGAALLIYSDSGRTDLLDTLTVAGYSTTKWRYIFGFINWNTGVGGEDFDGYTQNLNLNEPAVGIGAIYLRHNPVGINIISAGAG